MNTPTSRHLAESETVTDTVQWKQTPGPGGESTTSLSFWKQGTKGPVAAIKETILPGSTGDAGANLPAIGN